MSTTLQSQKREKVGSRHARAIRAEGRIPASIQATAESPHVDISIDAREFLASRRHHQHLYDIDVAGATETAIVRELQWDTFGQDILHVEFRRVVRGVEMESEVELVFEGMPKSGQLNHIVTHVTIRSLPSQIPDNIEVVVTELESGATILARDLSLPEGSSLAIPEDTLIAVIREARVQMEEAEPEAAEGEVAEGEESTAAPSEPTEE